VIQALEGKLQQQMLVNFAFILSFLKYVLALVYWISNGYRHTFSSMVLPQQKGTSPLDWGNHGEPNSLATSKFKFELVTFQ